jgi:hypothetical protein
MNKAIQRVWIFMLSLLFIGCSKPIPIQVPQEKPKLTIFSRTEKNQLLEVNISKSMSSYVDFTKPDSNQFELPEHLRVIMQTGGVRDTLSEIINGQFLTQTLVLTIGSLYHLEVFDSISQELVSSDALALPEVQDVTTIQVLRKTKDTSVVISTTIQDNLSQTNYYCLLVYDQTSLNNGYLLNPWNSKYLLLTNEGNHTGVIKQQFTLAYYDHLVADYSQDTLAIDISQISKEYYDFLQVYSKINPNSINLFPAQINPPSNIQHGYGVFTAHTTVKKSFDLKQF